MSGNAKRKRHSFSDEFKHSAVELIVKQVYSFRDRRLSPGRQLSPITR